MQIAGRDIGPEYPVYVVAEISCNHLGSYDKAVELVHAAQKAGADAVKFQAYTPDTITLDADSDPFQITSGTWSGQTLHELYEKAYTPWEWLPKLKELSESLGLGFFCSPFDFSAVDFLEELDVPAYKIASFELVDIPLIERVAKTGKPVVISTGLGNFEEIMDAVFAAKQAGAKDVVVLKCTSSYPANPDEMNLSSIPHLSQALNVPVGLSDHSLGTEVATAAVALGAVMIEKHLILSREDGGPDAGFSLEPEEFAQLVQAARSIKQAMGQPDYQRSEQEEENLIFRRSLFVAEDIAEGELITETNVRSVRPGHGLPPKYLPLILGKRVTADVKKGTPLSWDLIVGGKVQETQHV